MASEVTIYHHELAKMVNFSPQSVALFEAAGKRIRDQARSNAGSISATRANAIDTDLDRDSEGLYIDVGYNKHHPGFVLWWAEVGSRHQSPSPHLRPAVQAGRV